MLTNCQPRSLHTSCGGLSNVQHLIWCVFVQAAVSGDKAKDKSQGELTGILKTMGYTADQVFKF